MGTGYFDRVQSAITEGRASTAALAGSTEEAQFEEAQAEVEAGANLEFQQLHLKVGVAFHSSPEGRDCPIFSKKEKMRITDHTGSANVLIKRTLFQITMPETVGDSEILTAEALKFVSDLHHRFEGRRQALLMKRRDRQFRLDEVRKGHFAFRLVEKLCLSGEMLLKCAAAMVFLAYVFLF